MENKTEDDDDEEESENEVERDIGMKEQTDQRHIQWQNKQLALDIALLTVESIIYYCMK